MIKIDSDCYGTILLVWAIVLLLAFVVIRFIPATAVRIPSLVLLGVFALLAVIVLSVKKKKSAEIKNH